MSPAPPPPRIRRYAAGRARTLGAPTRGTTNPNRLRRNDNWIVAHERVAAVLGDPDALAVDLGYGATPVTTVELADRLQARFPRTRMLGLEIDPDRVAAGVAVADPPRLDFARGGFELAGRRPQLVRAMNVLRQYDEAAATTAWTELCGRLAPGGLLVEGTCDEVGRLGSWVLLDGAGPVSLTLSCSVQHLDHPRSIAERLPKALIHHNVPGRPVHALLAALGAAWDTAAPLAVFGPRQRWTAAAAALAPSWPVLSTPRRHRFGELTVAWSAVASG
ncbi:hypothetical protein [Nakamurella deserti]|uniref:hypothetical protein n=1 Tax=Nakamurella deserti TaxID=2164074 RepID=UPI001F0CA56F|nr:hypothetical protein [Nakamurella deserti]